MRRGTFDPFHRPTQFNPIGNVTRPTPFRPVTGEDESDFGSITMGEDESAHPKPFEPPAIYDDHHGPLSQHDYIQRQKAAVAAREKAAADAAAAKQGPADPNPGTTQRSQKIKNILWLQSTRSDKTIIRALVKEVGMIEAEAQAILSNRPAKAKAKQQAKCKADATKPDMNEEEEEEDDVRGKQEAEDRFADMDNEERNKELSKSSMAELKQWFSQATMAERASAAGSSFVKLASWASTKLQDAAGDALNTRETNTQGQRLDEYGQVIPETPGDRGTDWKGADPDDDDDKSSKAQKTPGDSAIEQGRERMGMLRAFMPIAGTVNFEEQETEDADELKIQNLMMGMSKPQNFPLGNVSNKLWVQNMAREGMLIDDPLFLFPPTYQGGSLNDGKSSLYGTYPDAGDNWQAEKNTNAAASIFLSGENTMFF